MSGRAILRYRRGGLYRGCLARLIPTDVIGPGAIEAEVARFIDRQLAGSKARAP
jgi:gluconate 2-dehydrogenase subunit 3-like protein